MTDVVWDRYSIKAEVHRRGKTLVQVAREGGAWDTACREALIHPCRTGEILIARFLGVSRATLWPERSRIRIRALRCLNRAAGASPKASETADTQAAA